MGGLFVALRTGLVRPEGLRFVAGLLTRHMGLFFVPAGVVAVALFPSVRADAWGIVAASVVSTLLVALVTAKVAGGPA